MTVQKTTVFTIDGQSIHASENGPPDAKLALLIHCWGGSRYALSPLLPMVSQRFHAVAVDLPGYGDSPPLPGRVTIGDYVELMATLIRAIAQPPVVLIGHSMGGMISVTLGLRYPDLVERMVLICPTISGHLSLYINLFVSPVVLLERLVPSQIMRLIDPYVVRITDRLLRPSQFAERTNISEQQVERIWADVHHPGQGRVRAECFWAMRANDLRGKLSQLKMPTLAMWGMEDNCVPLRDASAVARECPEAEVRIIPNAGHWPQFESPQITERYVKAFLSTPLKLLNVQF
jgi:pimeloyl-ACP methyl ester carboxylesterase